VTDILGVILLFLLLFPTIKVIAQHTIDNSQLDIKSVAVQNPTNNSFQFQMVVEVTHAGFIPATIEFTEPVNVYWDKDGNLTQLGLVDQFDNIKASHGHASINLSAPFQITDEEAFGQFTSYMITSPSFTWRIQSENLRVHALKFPVASGIRFNKTINLTGIENFGGNIQLVSFALPQDVPDGGITFNAVTALENNSPFRIDLETAIFNLNYNGVFIGQGTSSNTQLIPGNNTISLTGRLIPHYNSQSELVTLRELFTNFINRKETPVSATGFSTTQSAGQVIGWLSKGLQSLQLNVPFKPLSTLDPIQAINIGYFNRLFSEDAPYSPLTTRADIPRSIQSRPTQHIVQKAVDASVLEIFTVLITDPKENSFVIQMDGSIRNVSQSNWTISFPEGLNISWGGSLLGTISMSDVYVFDGAAVRINNTSTFRVADVNHLTNFTKTLLISESFEWTFTGNNLSVNASGITFPGISLGPKNVKLNAFNQLKNNVQVDSFDLHSDGHAGATHLILNATVTNPSQVGIAFSKKTKNESTISFKAFYQGVDLGLLTGSFAADNNFTLHLDGIISGDNLKTIGQLFSNFFNGNDSTLQIKGNSVDPFGSGAVASWFLTAFQSVTLDVILPSDNNLPVR
jgi:hypothetical protein